MSFKTKALTLSLTAGLLIGNVSITTPAYADTTLTVTPNYNGVTAEGNYSQSGALQAGMPTLLTVTGPNNTVFHIDQGQTDKDGHYKFAWTMPAQAPNGSYTAKVHIQGDVQTQSFTYSASSTGNSDLVTPVNLGPYRFTGELNAGQQQVVIYNSDNGLAVASTGGNASVTLSESKVKTAIRNATSGTKYLTISVPTKDRNATVSVPGSVLAQMTSSWGNDAHLLVAAESGSYDLPLSALNSTMLNSVKNDTTGSLQITIKRPDSSVSGSLTWKVVEMKGRELSPAVEFGVQANYGGQKLPIRDYGNIYVRYSIDLSGAKLDTSMLQTALFLNTDNTLVPAPTRLYRDAVGYGKLVISRPGNGIYQPVQAKRTFDDTKNYYLASKIENLASKYIISGKSESQYDPFGPLTRAEFATLMVRALGVADKEGTSPFYDVPQNDWFTNYVAIGSTLGLISGISTYEFAPYAPITREQMAALLARSLQFVKTNKPYVDTIRVLSTISDQNQISSWAREDVALSVSAGILTTTFGKLEPTRNATRAESAEMLHNFLNYLQMN